MGDALDRETLDLVGRLIGTNPDDALLVKRLWKERQTLVDALRDLGYVRFSEDGEKNICRYCDETWPKNETGHRDDCLWLLLAALDTEAHSE